MNADEIVARDEGLDSLELQAMPEGDRDHSRCSSSLQSLHDGTVSQVQQDGADFVENDAGPVSPIDNLNDESHDPLYHHMPHSEQTHHKAGPHYPGLARPDFNANEQLTSQSTDLVPRSIDRLSSARMLRRLALDIAIGLLSLYFIVFAILARVHHNNPIADDVDSEALLAAAQFGPTIFAIVFAAIVGRFLKSIAATFLERGTTIGLIECLLGGRTVAAATALPLSLRFLHPVMIILLLIWSMSPLGGQAALRVVRTAASDEKTPSTFQYLDVTSSPFIVTGASARQAYGNIILAAFNSALSSPFTTKRASQDLYGNLKIPMIEPLAAEQDPDSDGWHSTTPESDLAYSSLAGLPFIGTISEGNSEFPIESSYMSANCSLDLQQQPTRFLQTIYNSNVTFPTNPVGSIITNELHMAFIMDRDRSGSVSRPLAITMFSEALQTSPLQWHLTTATCTITTSYVETQVICEGVSCKVSAIRESTLPHSSSNLTALDAIWASGDAEVPRRITQETFFSLLINATTQDFRNIHIARASPFEYHFVNPGSPFNAAIGDDAPVLYGIGDLAFSHRLTQLINTLWLDSIAPYALTGNFTSPSNADYRVATAEGMNTRTREVLHCDDGWLAILFLTSFVVLAAGVGTAVLDASRKGPEILDSFVFALRDNKYVRIPLGSSMDDSTDVAKRLRKVAVRLGDVHSNEEVGHVAIGTPADSDPIEPMGKGRLYD